MKILLAALALALSTPAYAVNCAEDWVPTSIGRCMPPNSVECGDGYCPPGSTCSERKTCLVTHLLGLGLPAGPICPGFDLPCPYQNVCGPHGECYDPQKSKICPDGATRALDDPC
jgi:hypothetical protein